ncbi:MAG: hypothetical protein LW878_13505, partial [Proteobacteria bacterium]|nr:hypothetical protein [Pseudomonadota bacterium]
MRFSQILLLLFIVSCNVAQMKPQIQAGAQGTGPNAGVTVSFTSESLIGNEGFGFANLTFTLSQPLAADTTFNFSFAGSADGSSNCAISGTDYERPVGDQVTLAAGSTSGILSLRLCQDTVFENVETIQVSMAGSTPSVVIGTYGIISYTLNDNLGRPSVAFRTVATSVDEEDAGSVLYTNPLGSHVEVFLTHQSVETVGAQIFLSGNAVIGSSCSLGVDYVYEGALSFPVATIEFDPLEDSIILPIRICGDTVIEGNDSIAMSLQAPVNASLGVQQDHSFTMLNDDFVVGDTNIVASMFATSTASNNEGTTVNVWVVLDGTKDVDTILNYTVDSTTAITTAQRATFGSDFQFTGSSSQTGSVTIPAFTSLMNIPIQINQDSIYEPTESFFVRILPSEDIVPDSNASLQITEVPIAVDPVDTKPVVTFSLSSQSVFESNVVNSLIVRLVDPVTQTLAKASGTDVTFALTVNPIGADPVAVINTDYFISTGLTNLTIPAGQTQMVIPLSIVQDGIDEFDERFRVSLDLTSSFDLNFGTYAAGSTPNQDVTILDVDEAPSVSFTTMVTYTTSSNLANTAYSFNFHFSRLSQKPVTINFSGA